MRDMQILDHHNPDKGIWLVRNPNAPKIENPTVMEQNSLDAWWHSVMVLAEKIREEQRFIPGWLPGFRIIDIWYARRPFQRCDRKNHSGAKAAQENECSRAVCLRDGGKGLAKGSEEIRGGHRRDKRILPAMGTKTWNKIKKPRWQRGSNNLMI